MSIQNNGKWQRLCNLAFGIVLVSTLAGCGKETSTSPPEDVNADAIVDQNSDLEPEELTVETLPTDVSREHWVWLTDYVLGLYGKAVLIDADNGVVKGSFDTGWEPMKIEQSRLRGEVYAVRIFLDRGYRGKRTDVFSIYDENTLNEIAEIELPPKRLSGFGTLAHSGMTDDERFVISYNFTPASSVAIIDLEKRVYVGEIETAGCALVYPTGNRSFFSLCGDGSALHIVLGDDGKEKSRTEISGIFDPDKDPLIEKAVRRDSDWYFSSFSGEVYVVNGSDGDLTLRDKWSLLDDESKAGSWKPGGFQPFAIHEDAGLFYAIMHQGGEDTHKELGKEVWVFDVEKKKRVKRIELEALTGSIEISQDAKPLLFATAIFDTNFRVYDATSGKMRKLVTEAAFNPTIIQPIRSKK